MQRLTCTGPWPNIPTTRWGAAWTVCSCCSVYRLTEADVRLFPTVFRFDPVYFTRFRLDARRAREHAHLQRWLDDMLAWPGVVEASNLEHCKQGYFGRTGNNIVPIGPG